MKMQDQIWSCRIHSMLSRHIQEICNHNLIATNRDLFSSKRELQPLRKVVCWSLCGSKLKPLVIFCADGYSDGNNSFVMSIKGTGDLATVRGFSYGLREVRTEGSRVGLVIGTTRKGAVLSMKIKELQQRPYYELPSIL